MNKVILSGNLTRDPEAGQTNSGISYTRFTIAVQRRFANADGEREADFLNCTAWRQTAEFIAKYFKKGSKIMVVGSIQTRSYDGQDGQRKFATDIVVDEAEFAGSRSEGANADTGASEPARKPQAKLEPVEEDDLPF